MGKKIIYCQIYKDNNINQYTLKVDKCNDINQETLTVDKYNDINQ